MLAAHQLIADSQLTAWKLAGNTKRSLEVPDFDDRFVVRPPHWWGGGHFHALNQYSMCSLCQLTNADPHCHFRNSAEQQPSTEQLGANCVADPFWLTALASDPRWSNPHLWRVESWTECHASLGSTNEVQYLTYAEYAL